MRTSKRVCTRVDTTTGLPRDASSIVLISRALNQARVAPSENVCHCWIGPREKGKSHGAAQTRRAHDSTAVPPIAEVPPRRVPCVCPGGKSHSRNTGRPQGRIRPDQPLHTDNKEIISFSAVFVLLSFLCFGQGRTSLRSPFDSIKTTKNDTADR